MSRSVKAALLSCLIFPGIGHLYLRLYVRGILLLAAAAVLFYFLVSVTLQAAFVVVEEVQDGNVPPDVQVITQLVSKQFEGKVETTNSAAIALMLLWVIGIADSYRVGRAQENLLVTQANSRSETVGRQEY